MRRCSITVLFMSLVLTTVVYAEPIESKGLTVVSPFGAYLKGACIEVEKLDGTKQRFTLGASDRIIIREVPLGILKVTILSWKGVPINYTVTVTLKNLTIVCPKIGKIVFRVLGARKQALADAYVRILYDDKTVEEGTTDSSGTYISYLPYGDYHVEISYGGKSKVINIDVSETFGNEYKVTLDIFAYLGAPLSTVEFLGLIMFALIMIFVIIVIVFEYQNLRRRKLARVVSRS